LCLDTKTSRGPVVKLIFSLCWTSIYHRYWWLEVLQGACSWNCSRFSRKEFHFTNTTESILWRCRFAVWTLLVQNYQADGIKQHSVVLH